MSIDSKFLQKNDSWLKGTFSASETLFAKVRRTKSLDESFEKSKKRRVEQFKSVVINNDIDATEKVEKMDNEILIQVAIENIIEEKKRKFLLFMTKKMM